jgi:hypothetical protein
VFIRVHILTLFMEFHIYFVVFRVSIRGYWCILPRPVIHENAEIYEVYDPVSIEIDL